MFDFPKDSSLYFAKGFFEEYILLCLNRTLFPESGIEGQFCKQRLYPEKPCERQSNEEMKTEEAGGTKQSKDAHVE